MGVKFYLRSASFDDFQVLHSLYDKNCSFVSNKLIVTRYSSGVNADLLYIVVYMRENMQEFLVIYTFFLEITESLWYDARA